MMEVYRPGISKNQVEFLQACSRSFADTLRFIYCHKIGESFDVCYKINSAQESKICDYENYEKESE